MNSEGFYLLGCVSPVPSPAVTFPFAMWVDAVIFVFSLEDEISFQTVYHYYSRMANYRNTSEVPLVLVGTQDAISSTNPRVIDDARARKLSSDLKRCTYYETCATYGLNVERVFQDGFRRLLIYAHNASGWVRSAVTSGPAWERCLHVEELRVGWPRLPLHLRPGPEAAGGTSCSSDHQCTVQVQVQEPRLPGAQAPAAHVQAWEQRHRQDPGPDTRLPSE
ncbi:hypothetical protein CB1_000327002 [Camelus ferus]|nr:hypothetical protein CB1_000327002 [Camelus ferus]